MAFNAKKYAIDLTLDLTHYIPGEAGQLDSDRKTAAEIFEWAKFAAREADGLQEKINAGLNNETMIVESRMALIRQIDWFYGKGPKFWEAIPLPVLKDLIGYLRGEVTAIEKK